VQHRRTQDARRACEEHFRALSEHAGDLVGILDAEGTYRYASPSYRRILVYAPAERRGRIALCRRVCKQTDRAGGYASRRPHQLTPSSWSLLARLPQEVSTGAMT
jgi:PAS domain-containing protein